MSLDIYLRNPEETRRKCMCVDCGNEHEVVENVTLWESNITHNVGRMFDEAGVYQILWRGDGMIARDVLPQLEAAESLMRSDPQRFKAFSASNGWGTYEQALPWLQTLIGGFRSNPDGVIHCSC